ncbi:F-box domain-containing protein [Hypomontagnella monticulosa]|nr:F-box domain-containing protein [Hypomontagnella monticulosa]
MLIPSPASPSPSNKDGLYTLDQTDAVIRVASYHRTEFDLTVISFNPQTFHHARSSVFKPLGPSIASNPTRLESLPLEILTSICLMLDVSAAFYYCQVNRRAREVISSIWEYRQLSEHALECICALLRTRIAPHITMAALYSALTTKNCYLCNSFSGFFFLPTTTRCCFSCISTANRLKAITAKKLSEVSGVSIPQLKRTIPILRVLPGKYSTVEVNRGQNELIVAEPHCLDVLRRSGVKEPRSEFNSWQLWSTPSFAASISLPYFDPITSKIDIGVCCTGCRQAAERFPPNEILWHQESVYSRDGFMAHFQQCVEAKNLWALS